MKHLTTYQHDHLLSYAVYGDPSGYPVFIQHGLIASIDEYALFNRLLALGACLICIARPGYGASSPYTLTQIVAWADLVALIIAERKLAQFDVLGISSGAPYSYAIGYKFPDQVRNLYILSGIPALYDAKIAAHWPYGLNQQATMAELEKLVATLFFADLSEAALTSPAIKDSMMHNGFGLAQDLKLRVLDWGFTLAEVKSQVYLRHSRGDEAVPLVTAEMTAALLPNCHVEISESAVHFSNESLDDFIETVIAPHYV